MLGLDPLRTAAAVQCAEPASLEIGSTIAIVSAATVEGDPMAAVDGLVERRSRRTEAERNSRLIGVRCTGQVERPEIPRQPSRHLLDHDATKLLDVAPVQIGQPRADAGGRIMHNIQQQRADIARDLDRTPAMLGPGLDQRLGKE